MNDGVAGAITAAQSIDELEPLYGAAQQHEETFALFQRRRAELQAGAQPNGHRTSRTAALRVVRSGREQGSTARDQAAGRKAGTLDGIVDDDTELVPPPSNPMAVARLLVAQQYHKGETDLLLDWRGGFFVWEGRFWRESPEAAVRAAAYRFLEFAEYEAMTTDGPERRPWEPTKPKIANALEALRAVAHLSALIEPPVWLKGEGPDPHECLVMANGILHLPTRRLLPHHPRLFATRAVPFAYDPNAPVPERWLAFLDELWGEDEESIALAQETAGYLVSGDTSLQKIILIVGPTRAGKGVFAHVLSHLLGGDNVGAPTLAGLSSHFGLQDLIDKTLAVVSDARLGPKADVAALAERLLSISGGDAITVDRKYRTPWTGRLGVRFLLLTNELPGFSDASGALAKRFVVLVLTRSFYGREDPRLLDKLLAEVPGIFNWALAGLDRLRAQGHFTVPQAAQEAVRELEDLASPVAAFLRDRCLVERELEVPRDALWAAWKSWCEEQSLHHGTKAIFGRDLRAAIPGLRSSRPHLDGVRVWLYRGVGLRSDDNGAPPPGPSGPAGPGSGPAPQQRPSPSGPGGPGPAPLFARPQGDAARSDLDVEDDYPSSAWEAER